MKKIIRLLIASGVLMVIGGILILVAYMTNKDQIAELNGRFSSDIFEINEPITSIKLNATDGSVYVLYGESTRVTVDDCYMENVSVRVENGVLMIDEKFPETMSVAGWELPAFIVGCNSEHKDAITITVPENLVLNKAEFCMGKGDIRINGLSAYELQVQIGIGDFTSNPVKYLNHYVYQVPFGTVDFGGFEK